MSRRLFRSHPWWRLADPLLLVGALALALVGWLALWSVTTEGSGVSLSAVRQAGYIFLGSGLMVGLSRWDYRKLRMLAWPTYALSLLLLVAVLLPGVGRSANGAQRWLSLGPFGTLQPSEMAKLAFILLLAHVLANWLDQRERAPVSALAPGLLLAGVPFLLIASQPDLGTSLVVVACLFIMLFQAGVPLLPQAGLIVAGMGALPLVLKEYQRDRLLSFLNPDLDPSGTGYNLLQAKTALGSGGLVGKGLFDGPLSQHGFVPENHTDFIITAIGEELGLVAVLGVMLLFLLLLLLLARLLWRCREPFGTLLLAGIIALLAFQAVVNLSMTMGLLPVVGIPLPFMSYGGSAMLTNFAALGLAGSVAREAREQTVPLFGGYR